MSDLSVPPLQLVPHGDEPTGAAPAADEGSAGFVWPAPALADYAASSVDEPEPCELEGLNGRIMPGQLVSFDPVGQQLQLLAPHSRRPVALRFAQFRRLTLLHALVPGGDTADAETAEDPGATLAAPLDDMPADPLADNPPVAFQLKMRAGEPLAGWSVQPIVEPCGVFLFEPVDGTGRLRRHFVPKAAYSRFTVDETRRPQPTEATTAQAQAAQRAQIVGEALVVRNVETPDQLLRAIEAQSRMPMVRIGEALLALGFVTPAQLEMALEQQRADRSVPLGELLVRNGAVSRADLQQALSRKMGYPMVDARQFPPEVEALSRVPHNLASRLKLMPLILRGSRLIVALDDPGRRKVLEEIEFLTQLTVLPVLAHPEDLPEAIDRAYDRLGISAWSPAEVPGLGDRAERDLQDASELLASLEQFSAEQRRDDDEPQIEQSDNSLVKLINTMIIEAQNQGVSDIHIECQPGREKVRIRFRKDGQLRHYLELPHTYRAAIIARLKIMCDLDISERRKPQDGKITFGRFQPGSRLELRLATIPTHSHLEDAVLRLLASAKPLPLDQISLSPTNLEGIKHVMERPYGMLLCVGPTGSGKTTTLHSALGYINRPDRKIWTAEDPIEITQPGLRQVQVNARIDWTFAKALRAFLRADPDVVMVGEIRDQETAQMAIEASLTGHLVLSTLHTNSAAETVTRLLDMGMDPFNFADSLLGVLAQRLVRRLCPECRQVRDATPEEIDELVGDYEHAFIDGERPVDRGQVLAEWTARFAEDGRLRFHHSPGCPACDRTGFKGRVAIQELLVVSRETRRLIQTGARAEQLLAVAQREGMRTLRQDGIEKVLAGLTSIEEVRASSNV